MSSRGVFPKAFLSLGVALAGEAAALGELFGPDEVLARFVLEGVDEAEEASGGAEAGKGHGRGRRDEVAAVRD